VADSGRLLVEMAGGGAGRHCVLFVSYSYMDSIINTWNDMNILKVHRSTHRAGPALLGDSVQGSTDH